MTTKTGHTPDKYEIVHSDGSFALIKGDYVKITVDCSENYGLADRHARLIAAAPELLEALKSLIERAEESGFDFGDTGRVSDAKKAIEKACG